MEGDRNHANDLSIKRAERIGRPPATTPTTKEIPPTDEELALIDRIRRADDQGADELMIQVRSGRDVTKPAVINATLDQLRHLQRLERTVGDVVNRIQVQANQATADIRKAEKMVGDEIKAIDGRLEALEAAVNAIVLRLEWAGLSVVRRRRRDRPELPKPIDKGPPAP